MMLLPLFTSFLSTSVFYFTYRPMAVGRNQRGFLRQGAGHHVGGDCINHCRVYFCYIQNFSIWLLVCDCCFAAGVVFSDSKQVVVVFLVSLVVLLIAKLKNPGGIAVLSNYNCGCWIRVLGCTILFATSFRYWSKPELSQGLQFKYSILSIITSYYDSP